MDSAGLLFVCLTQRFSICQLCVWICVLGCDRGVSRLHRPWWIGHCVSIHVCVCVVSCNVCTLVFSSTQKRSESECWSFFSSLSPPTKHTNTHFGPCAGHRSVWMPTLIQVNDAIHQNYYFTCQTSLFLSCPWIIISRLVTHISRQVAISSASRHATMTKDQRGSKLLWLPRSP